MKKRILFLLVIFLFSEGLFSQDIGVLNISYIQKSKYNKLVFEIINLTNDTLFITKLDAIKSKTIIRQYACDTIDYRHIGECVKMDLIIQGGIHEILPGEKWKGEKRFRLTQANYIYVFRVFNNNQKQGIKVIIPLIHFDESKKIKSKLLPNLYKTEKITEF